MPDLKRLAEAFLFQPAEHFGLTSGSFAVLLLLLLFLYPLVGRTRRSRTWTLVGFSLFFYYKASGLFVGVLVLSSVVDFVLGAALGRTERRGARRAGMWAGVLANLAVLYCFRYSHGWADLVGRATSAGLPLSLTIAPIGVSFYAFQKISYLVDVYRRTSPPVTDLGDFLAYVCFFPRLLAGPIVRVAEFVPQLEAAAPNRADVGEAVSLIGSGLLKKAVIADYIAVNFVSRVFAAPALYSGAENLLAVYGYAVQIYCDFSGYTDIALGVGRLLGFRLPPNFASPYKAKGVTDFWRRWHITLSFWLRDYVFLPLAFALSRRVTADRVFGVRTDIWIYTCAAMVTWFACGLWHGAALGFIVWGLMHGAGVAVEKMTRWPKRIGRWRVPGLVQQAITFHFVCAAWVFFRADTVGAAATMFHQIGRFLNPAQLPQIAGGYPLVTMLIVCGFLLHWLPDRAKRLVRGLIAGTPLPLQSIALAGVLWIVLQIRSADIQPFIYFRF